MYMHRYIHSIFIHIYIYIYMGVAENRGPQYSTLNSRILIIRIPK